MLNFPSLLEFKNQNFRLLSSPHDEGCVDAPVWGESSYCEEATDVRKCSLHLRANFQRAVVRFQKGVMEVGINIAPAAPNSRLLCAV